MQLPRFRGILSGKTNAAPSAPSVLLYMQYVVFGSLILYIGRDLFIPIAYAVLISFLLYPSCAWMERKGVGRMTAVLINITLLILVVTGLLALLAQQFVMFLDEWPAFQQKLVAVVSSASSNLADALGFSQASKAKMMSRLTEEMAGGTIVLLGNAISVSTWTGVAMILIPVYAVLILYNRRHWVKILYRIFPSERNEGTRQILLLTNETYFNFFKGMGLVYLAVGILNSIGLLLLGVPYAIMFGFIASILTVVPYIGIVIGSLLPLAIAWTTHDSIWYPIGVIGIFTFVQYLEANVIFPVAVSNRLKLNTLVVLIAIFAGGILWGVSGMILFVPFVGIVKLIADNNHRLKTLAMILGSEENAK